MTRRSRILTSLVLVSLVAGGLWLAPAAEASHRSFRWTGHCYGFPGEAEMISALNHMDAALAAYGLRERMQAVHAARHDLRMAQRYLSCPHARRELSRAISPLTRFAVTGEYHRLAEAGQRVTQGLEMERLVHAHVRPPVHHSRGIYHPGHPVAAPVVPGPHHLLVPGRSAGVHFGNSRFSIGINF